MQAIESVKKYRHGDYIIVHTLKAGEPEHVDIYWAKHDKKLKEHNYERRWSGPYTDVHVFCETLIGFLRATRPEALAPTPLTLNAASPEVLKRAEVIVGMTEKEFLELISMANAVIVENGTAQSTAFARRVTELLTMTDEA